MFHLEKPMNLQQAFETAASGTPVYCNLRGHASRFCLKTYGMDNYFIGVFITRPGYGEIQVGNLPTELITANWTTEEPT